MPWLARYFVCAIPAAVTLGGWAFAAWAYDNFNCEAVSKGLASCYAGSLNITWFVGVGLFWCQLLAWVAVPMSLWFLGKTYEQHRNFREKSLA